jgi:hypothetical protein
MERHCIHALEEYCKYAYLSKQHTLSMQSLKILEPGIVVLICNHSTQDVETGGS